MSLHQVGTGPPGGWAIPGPPSTSQVRPAPGRAATQVRGKGQSAAVAHDLPVKSGASMVQPVTMAAPRARMLEWMRFMMTLGSARVVAVGGTGRHPALDEIALPGEGGGGSARRHVELIHRPDLDEF